MKVIDLHVMTIIIIITTNAKSEIDSSGNELYHFA